MTEEMQQLEDARDVMISAIAQTMVIYGVTPSVGRIYGLLYFSDQPLTLDEIKDQVAMSKASVSNGIKDLLETEMVTKVWKKGNRKDHYIAEKDFLKNFLTFFVKMLRMERSLISKAIEQTEPTFSRIADKGSQNEIKDMAAKDLNLITDSKQYLDWVMRLANAMESGEIFNYFPKSN
ncbi:MULTISPECIES: GbsR/MarR family transcriptional regulator [Sediminibacillus]|uniref:GbsR/MarR family transcriptional regulator n=1 Tax=Sediminibacillus TaxID=482460 RepID=UPI001296688B|nr:transcriptional regulator [Sediminibacillus terrae]